MNTIALRDVFDACCLLANSSPVGATWVNSKQFAAAQAETESVGLLTDNYFLVLCSDPRVSVRRFSTSKHYTFIPVVTDTCPVLAPILTFMATGIVLDTDVRGLELQAFAASMVARSRGVPVITVGGSDLLPSSSLLRTAVTHHVDEQQDLCTFIDQLIPSARFPFLLGAGNPTDGPAFIARAPLEFLTDAQPNTPRFSLVMQRLLNLARHGFSLNRMALLKPYYACFMGDLCMSITDEHGKRLVHISETTSAYFQQHQHEDVAWPDTDGEHYE